MPSLRFSTSMWFPLFAPPPFLLAASFVALGWLAIVEMLNSIGLGYLTAPSGPEANPTSASLRPTPLTPVLTMPKTSLAIVFAA